MIHLITFSVLYIGGFERAKLNGTYTMKVVVKGEINHLVINLPLPVDFHGCTTYQKVLSMDYSISPEPQGKTIVRMKEGKFLKVEYGRLSQRVCVIKVNFLVERGIRIDSLPDDMPYEQIPQGSEGNEKINGEIISLAKNLSKGIYTIKGISQRIVYYIANNIRYYTKGNEDAVNTFKDKSGNCMGISALAVSMFRCSGVESRLVAGISLEDSKEYIFRKGNAVYTIRASSFEGLHQWCEVKLPTCGWAELEPQGNSLFVPVGYIRLATGEEGVDYPHLIVYSYRGEPYVQYLLSVEGSITRVSSQLMAKRIEIKGIKPVMVVY